MKKAKIHSSDLIDELLNEITPREHKRTANRMRLAAKIADGLEAKGWSKQKLAEELGYKSSSIVTKWLSGTNNFTTDVLSDIQDVLGIKLLNTDEVEEERVTVSRWKYSGAISQVRTGIQARNEEVNVESMEMMAVSINPWHGTKLTA
tara:strand:- start:747 stop:1190 length:444 start_codon:yes stop_codon:yes gene_type:complete